jgi:hypothetical protein
MSGNRLLRTDSREWVCGVYGFAFLSLPRSEQPLAQPVHRDQGGCSMLTTFSDQASPQPNPPRLCPQCQAVLQPVLVAVQTYRPAQTIWLCLDCSYTSVDS